MTGVYIQFVHDHELADPSNVLIETYEHILTISQ